MKHKTELEIKQNRKGKLKLKDKNGPKKGKEIGKIDFQKLL